MFFKEFVKRPSADNHLYPVTLMVALVLIFFINTDIAPAQSHQKQQLSRYQQQVLAKRERYIRYQRQKQKQSSGGLFGNLFGTAPVRKRRVYRRQRSAIPAPIPAAVKTGTRKKTKLAKSNTLGGYGNGKKAKRSRLPKSFSRKKRKPAGRRAMCVRLCDGFYWPVDKIGANLKKQNLKSICKASCSATTRVYYSSQGSGDTAQSMRDLRGNRYRDLKNAFLYRKQLKRSCRCRPEPWSAAAQKVYQKRLQKAEELPADITGKKKKEKRTATLRNAL